MLIKSCQNGRRSNNLPRASQACSFDYKKVTRFTVTSEAVMAAEAGERGTERLGTEVTGHLRAEADGSRQIQDSAGDTSPPEGTSRLAVCLEGDDLVRQADNF